MKFNERWDKSKVVGTKESVQDEIRARVEQDENERQNREYYAKHGKLSQYIESKGEVFTFGMLRAIFEDSLDAKRKRDLAKGGYKFLHRAIPYANAALTVNPIIWFIGMVFGSLRAFNKIIAQVLKDPGRNYPEFLKKIVVNTMNVAEGEIKPLLGEDKFFNLFVVSDDITKIVRKDVLLIFANELCEKMSEEPDDKEVPDHYIENELKAWLHQIYDLTYTFKKKGKRIKKYKPSKIEIPSLTKPKKDKSKKERVNKLPTR